MKVKFIAIAAMGKNREIGLKGKLPWSIPEEYQQFKDTIRGEYALTGRKNFELHGGAIEDVTAFVMTRDREYQSENALVFYDMDEVIAYAGKNSIGRIFVMGGAEIYALAMPYVSEFICSEVDYDGPADTFFPEFNQYQWEEIERTKYAKWTLRRLVK